MLNSYAGPNTEHQVSETKNTSTTSPKLERKPDANNINLWSWGGIVVTKRSSIRIERSKLHISLVIKDESNITVVDSIFHGDQYSILLSNIWRTYAYFNNCTFIDGGTIIMANNRASVTIEKSRIMHQDTSSFLISGSSILEISSTEITDNEYLDSTPFVCVQSQSSFRMTDSFYARNIASRHIMATENSFIKINNCRFLNNSAPEGNIIDIDGGPLKVEKSKFINNSGLNGIRLYSDATLGMHNCSVAGNVMHGNLISSTISDVTLNNCSFEQRVHNTDASILRMAGQVFSYTNYIQIENCEFVGNISLLEIDSVIDVNLQSSIFHQYSNNDEGISLVSSSNIRIADCDFKHSKPQNKAPIIVLSSSSLLYLLTFRSNLSDDSNIIESQSDDFMQRSRNLGLLHPSSYTVYSWKETGYASGKQEPQYKTINKILSQ